MATLSETQRIYTSIFIGCEDKRRTQQKACDLLKAKYPDLSTDQHSEK